jgi:hypothetical protein
MHRHWFEKRADRNVEDRRDLRQAPGTHAICALLLFLHLLKRDPKPAGKIALGHSGDQPMRPNGLADLSCASLALRTTPARPQAPLVCSRALYDGR